MTFQKRNIERMAAGSNKFILIFHIIGLNDVKYRESLDSITFQKREIALQ